MIAWWSRLFGGGTPVIEPATLRDAHRLAQLHAAGNKYSRGHALLYGGYPMTGAARMAARAAARIGAGLTSIVVLTNVATVTMSSTVAARVQCRI